jgi:anti-sigma factor RsiW
VTAARHPRPDELELYVLGALDRETALRLERHVRRCSPCAAALAEEARVETTLRELVPAVGQAPAKVVRLPRPAPPPRPRAGFSGALGAAAAILVAVWGLGGERGGAPGTRALGAAVAGPNEGPALVCELEREAPLCPWPAALASMPALAAAEEGTNICRAPASCPIQSRGP